VENRPRRQAVDDNWLGSGLAEPPVPRIGHAERDHAVELLREAAGLGRIDLDELDERVEQAMAARTQPELDALLADLRTQGTTGPQEAQGAQPAALQAPGHRPDDPLVLAAGASTIKRSGRWELPAHLTLSPVMGSIKLDCREAVVRTPVVEVEVVGSVGSIKVVVPEGWAANVDRLTPGLGSIKNRLPAVAAPGCPTLVLRGSMGAGSVTLRHPNRWDRRPEREERSSHWGH
jgi:hypothetical protein